MREAVRSMTKEFSFSILNQVDAMKSVTLTMNVVDHRHHVVDDDCENKNIRNPIAVMPWRWWRWKLFSSSSSLSLSIHSDSMIINCLTLTKRKLCPPLNQSPNLYLSSANWHWVTEFMIWISEIGTNCFNINVSFVQRTNSRSDFKTWHQHWQSRIWSIARNT